MNPENIPTKSEIAGWCDKLEKANDSVVAVQISKDDKDAILAARVLKQAYFHGILTRDDGGDNLNVDAKVERPDCLVCGGSTVENAGKLLFCSDDCQEFAGYVRYARKKIDEEMPWDLDLLKGFGRKIIHWVSSGHVYDSRGRYLPRKTREEILFRDGQRCAICGEPATEIDHIAGSSSEPANLRAVCADCNRKLMLGNLVPTTKKEKRVAMKARGDHLSSLISAPIPPSIAFDHATWINEWRSVEKMRKFFLRRNER